MKIEPSKLFLYLYPTYLYKLKNKKSRCLCHNCHAHLPLEKPNTKHTPTLTHIYTQFSYKDYWFRLLNLYDKYSHLYNKRDETMGLIPNLQFMRINTKSLN